MRYFSKSEAGNIIVLILIAVALFGALTFTLSKSMRGGHSNELSEMRVKQYASELITYASVAESVVNQMNFNGSDISEIDPILPSDANFEVGSDIHKLFHIDGGGLNYKPAKEPPFISGGMWSPGTGVNFEWTPTTADDLAILAIGVEQTVCEELNEIITGDSTIPALGVYTTDITSAECPACAGRPSLCVDNAVTSNYMFYSVIGAQ